MQQSNKIVYDLAGDFTMFNFVHEYVNDPRAVDTVIKIIAINAVKKTANKIWDLLESNYGFIAPEELRNDFNGKRT